MKPMMMNESICIILNIYGKKGEILKKCLINIYLLFCNLNICLFLLLFYLIFSNRAMVLCYLPLNEI